MNKLTTSTAIPTRALKLEALSNISASFELLCLACGMEALGEMMDQDAQVICGPRHARGHFRRAHRWGCLLYTSDAADDLLCVDLGGRRIIKKKKENTKN